MGKWTMLEGTVTQTDLGKKSQSYGGSWCEAYDSEGVRYRVRWVLRVDGSYPGQSTVRAEVWTVGGWVELWTVHGSNPEVVRLTAGSGHAGPEDKAGVLRRLVDGWLRPAVEGLLP